MMRPGAVLWRETFQRLSAEQSGIGYGFGPDLVPNAFAHDPLNTFPAIAPITAAALVSALRVRLA